MVNLPQKYSVVQLYEKKVLDKLVTKKNILKPVYPIVGNKQTFKKKMRLIASKNLCFFHAVHEKKISGDKITTPRPLFSFQVKWSFHKQRLSHHCMHNGRIPTNVKELRSF